jgi:hypothetical protein
VVLGIGHSIQNNDWVTKIDTQYIILDSPGGTKLTPKGTIALPPLQEPRPPAPGPEFISEIDIAILSGTVI